MQLLLVIIEGQLYLAGILAIFVAELAFLFWASGLVGPSLVSSRCLSRCH